MVFAFWLAVLMWRRAANSLLNQAGSGQSKESFQRCYFIHSMNYEIRPPRPGEEPRIVEMAKALLLHLGDDIDNFNDEDFLGDAFGDEPQFSIFVAATPENKLIGYTIFHDAYEPSHTARGVYVVDLFVDVGMRGAGVGTALLRAVARDGSARGRNFIWLVTTSDQARAYYDNVMDIKVEVTAYALTAVTLTLSLVDVSGFTFTQQTLIRRCVESARRRRRRRR